MRYKGAIGISILVHALSRIIELPYPVKASVLSIEEALLARRSIREYSSEPVKLRDLALILWATYGVSDPVEGLKTTPSAGATYPLKVYVVVGARRVVSDEGVFLEEGIYYYNQEEHSLVLLRSGDYRGELMKAALMQEYVGEAPVSIVITAVYERTTSTYGKRGELRYVPMEAGHASQNTYLMATALGYGTVAVGAFRDKDVSRILGINSDETPLYIMPIGVPRSSRSTSFEELARYFEDRRKRNTY